MLYTVMIHYCLCVCVCVCLCVFRQSIALSLCYRHMYMYFFVISLSLSLSPSPSPSPSLPPSLPPSLSLSLSLSLSPSLPPSPSLSLSDRWYQSERRHHETGRGGSHHRGHTRPAPGPGRQTHCKRQQLSDVGTGRGRNQALHGHIQVMYR